MKRTSLLVVLALLVISHCMYRYSQNHTSITYHPYVGHIDSCYYVPNYFQHQSSIWLGVYEGQLYIYPQHTFSRQEIQYDGWLCILTADGITKLSKLGQSSQVRVIGNSGQFLYYWSQNDSGDDSLYCYDIELNMEVLLFSGKANMFETTFAAEDGSFYIPIYTNSGSILQEFVHVRDGQFVSITDKQMQYHIGELSCYSTVRDQSSIERIFVSDASIEEFEVKLDIARTRVILPCNAGFLIHNAGHCQLLYLIRSPNEITCMFEVPCMSSISAVTVVDDYAYLSFKRYKGYNGILLQRYDNDDLEGTYRINLINHTMQKISNDIFCGLYYFGGDHLFATDEYCNIKVLDMQGNLADVLISVK